MPLWRWRISHPSSSLTGTRLVSVLFPAHHGPWKRKELNVSRSLDWETSDKLRLCFVVQCLVNFSLHSLSTRTACLPRHKFPEDWHVTCTPNHWSNEDKMMEYIEKIILPYVEGKRKELELSVDQPALAIFDVFKGQQTEGVLKILEENNIYVVSVPANYNPWT